MKSTTKYLIAVVAVVLVIAAIAAVGMMSRSSETQTAAVPAQNTPEATANAESKADVKDAGTAAPQKAENPAPVKTEEPIVMPTFMYFISSSDANVSAAKEVYNSLSAEYGDRVKFELKDVDAEPDLKERFMINQEDSPIPMKTPTLIMLDVHNNISTIGLSECTDAEILRKAIEKALAA